MEFYCERTSTILGRPCDEATQVDENTYAIEINNLEQLMSFVDRYGEVIIIPPSPEGKATLPTIEIYDDWRE